MKKTIFLLLLDLLLVAVLLVLSWYLTNEAPLIDRNYTISDEHNLPVPEVEHLWVMIVSIWLLPVILLFLISIFVLKSIQKTLLILFVWLQNQAFVIFITAIVRYFFTSPRPYFNTVCSPTSTSGNIVNPKFCQNNIERRDVQSFFSGHSSSVWSSWIFLILISSYLLSTFRRKGGFYRLVFFFLPFLIVPIWMSSDRVTTGNHFLHEVIIGALVGILVALITFFNMDKDILRNGTQQQQQPILP